LPCPNCGKYQELTDEQIREIPNERGEKDHNPQRILKENAAEYECIACKGVILDIDRWKMIKQYKWLAEGEDFVNGEIINRNKERDSSRDVCFWPNRLLSMPDKFTFADCLASFFSARSSPDPKAWQAYQNEDMARFINPKAEMTSYSYLLSKQLDYYQYSELAKIPQGVEILFCGIDAQDDGFYYIVRGFGRNMETWLVRQDFIKCDMKDSRFNDPAEVLAVVRKGLLTPAYIREDGFEMSIYAGFFDEGGHRQADVRYVCKHLNFLRSYKGSSTPGADLIKRSSTGDHFLGNTQQLSEIVHRYMTGSTWYYPKDISKSYLEQVVKQYWQEERDSKGNLKYRWVKGGNDHYRDCENYIMGMVMLNNLQERLSTDRGMDHIREIVVKKSVTIEKTITKAEKPTAKPSPFRDPTAYRDMLRQGRRFI
jgi:phage terminase large subunit GpA-like protein